MEYKNKKCPVCKNLFQSSDDVVVCPECGTPYHRECYKKEGKCIIDHNSIPNSDEIENDAENFDGSNKEEASEKPEQDVNENNKSWNNQTQEGVVCSKCGKVNAYGSLFCNKCGNSLSDQNGQYNNFPGGFPYVRQTPPVVQYSQIDPKTTFSEDVTAEEYARVVAVNVPYYTKVAMKVKQGLSCGFNFCAFLFTALWFFFRKQYKTGVVFALLMGLIIAVNTYVSVAFSTPILAKLLSNIGIDYYTESITNADLMEASEYMYTLTDQEKIMFAVPSAISALEIGIMIFSGFIANKKYYKYCIGKAKELKSMDKDSYDYSLKLKKYSGVNMLLTVGVVIIYFTFNFVIKAVISGLVTV